MYRRHLHAFGVFLRPEGDGGGGGDDAVKKAQFERDTALANAQKLQTEIDALKKQVLTPEQKKKFDDLEAQQATLEEEKKKKAGEWETLKADMAKRHADEIKTLTEQIASLNTLIVDGEISRA